MLENPQEYLALTIVSQFYAFLQKISLTNLVSAGGNF